jgi:hypothetical protein
MKINESFELYGQMALTAYDCKRNKKEKLFRIVKRNQITDEGRKVVLELIGALGNYADDVTPPLTSRYHPHWNNIWSLGIGEDGTPAQASQVGLLAPVWNGRLTFPVEREYYPTLFEIHIQKEVPAGEATGSTLREAAIFTRGREDLPSITWEAILDRRMYARQTHAEFIKDATMSVVYEWHLGITVAS